MNENKKKIIILGSSGFLGSNLSFYFSKNDNYETFCCEKKDVNILQEEELNHYIESIKPDIIINCCGIVGSSEMNKYTDENEVFLKNVLLNNNILNSCKKWNITKLITFSTFRIFTESINKNYNETNIHSSYSIENNSGYLFSKKVLDLQIKLFEKKCHTKVVCFILSNVYGNYDKFEINGRIVSAFIKKIHLAKQSEVDLILDTNSENQVNLIYAKDVYRIVNSCLEEENIEGNIILFNKAGTITLKQLSEYLKTQLQFSHDILFSKKEVINSSIMHPDTSKFQMFFNNFSFSNIEESLKETIHYYMTTTGMS